MNVKITGRHMELSDALKSYIETGLRKVKAHFDRVIDVDVVLDVEKHRHTAEFNLYANGVRINCRETSPDMYASVDAALDKLERQTRKFKDRINQHKPRSAKETRILQQSVISLDAGNGNGGRDATGPDHHVVHREKIMPKPMSVDEAIMQLELVEEPFLLFMNADTFQLNVIYSRGEMQYGLIEPES